MSLQSVLINLMHPCWIKVWISLKKKKLLKDRVNKYSALKVQSHYAPSFKVVSFDNNYIKSYKVLLI